jgi:tol-pal system protein YbgF
MKSCAFPLLTALFLPLAAGCVRNAEERQLDSMRDEIDSVRENRDRADRVMNSPEWTGPPDSVPRALAPATPLRPPPPVVQLGASGQGDVDDSETADPQDTTPRPSIRVFGSQRSAVRNGWRTDDHVEEALSEDAPSAQNSAGRFHALDPEAKPAYDAALVLVNAKRFTEALDAFAAFLVKWPDHPYANNAMYWRGECYFARGEYQRASEQFDGVLTRFPAGSKVPDALLKLGMSYQKLGNPAKAKECFDRLAQQYADSEAARRIPTLRARTLPSPAPPGPSSEEHR